MNKNVFMYGMASLLASHTLWSYMVWRDDTDPTMNPSMRNATGDVGAWSSSWAGSQSSATYLITRQAGLIGLTLLCGQSLCLPCAIYWKAYNTDLTLRLADLTHLVEESDGPGKEAKIKGNKSSCRGQEECARDGERQRTNGKRKENQSEQWQLGFIRLLTITSRLHTHAHTYTEREWVYRHTDTDREGL